MPSVCAALLRSQNASLNLCTQICPQNPEKAQAVRQPTSACERSLSTCQPSLAVQARGKLEPHGSACVPFDRSATSARWAARYASVRAERRRSRHQWRRRAPFERRTDPLGAAAAREWGGLGEASRKARVKSSNVTCGGAHEQAHERVRQADDRQRVRQVDGWTSAHLEQPPTHRFIRRAEHRVILLGVVVHILLPCGAWHPAVQQRIVHVPAHHSQARHVAIRSRVAHIENACLRTAPGQTRWQSASAQRGPRQRNRQSRSRARHSRAPPPIARRGTGAHAAVRCEYSGFVRDRQRRAAAREP